MDYDFKSIEQKWQKRWDDEKLFEVDTAKATEKFYVLNMFPYPSGDRLHLGHWWQYGIVDSWARFKMMTGKKVFQPMGFDAFGLPAENHAIKKGVHPDLSTSKNVGYMIDQLKRIGVGYSWKHMLNTSKPDYYKWTQWLFLQFYKKGLAYRSKAPVNWCPSCQTVLANEQVTDGQCERCDTVVTKRDLTQWMFKITAYAEKLLAGIDGLEWPANTKAQQRNWIGRSEGAEVRFKVDASDKVFAVFTTRPDTLFGVTYVVLAPEHPLVDELTTPAQRVAVKEYVEKTARMTEIERQSTTKEKTGVFTGAYAINPVNGEKVPIWTADYVLRSYGTGAVMAVPGHDERDFAFAKAYSLPIRKVILQDGTNPADELKVPFTEVGNVINSGKFDGMKSSDMIPAIIRDLESQGTGQGRVIYRLRDWLVSRQRYWGAPIPIIHCPECGEQPVPEKDLPVRLPEDVEFKPTGESPLKRCPSFVNVACPKCGKAAQREADTLDTFVCSSWYYLRFPSVGDDAQAWNPGITKKFLPVDQYVGGKEHACTHLMFARFFTMALKDLGLVDFDEPFPKLFHQGIILGPDGARMSKSRGNTISPDPLVAEYGCDVLRLYLMFGFNFADGGPWDDGGFKAVSRFAERLWTLFEDRAALLKAPKAAWAEPSADDKKLLFVFNNTIKMVTQDTDRFMFNTSIARFMELLNALGDYFRLVPEDKQNKAMLGDVLRTFVLMIGPFAPHLAEERWEMIGGKESVFRQKWPAWDEKFLQLDEIPMAVMINGKLRDEIVVPAGAGEDEVAKIALAREKVVRWTDGQTIIKRIFVAKKLINFIVKGQ